MKKIYTLFAATLLFQLFSYSQINITVAGYGGTGNCDGNLRLYTCSPNIILSITNPNGAPFTTGFIDNMCPGTYSAYLTNASSGATALIPINYSNNGQITLTATGANVFSAFAQTTQSTSSSVCNGNIFLDIQGGTPPYSITWYNPTNQIVSGQSNDTLNNICPNGYGFQVISSSSSCNAIGVIPTSNTTTAVLSHQKENNISIYPNPTSGIFNIYTQNAENTTLIEITDILGNSIYKKANTNQSIQFDLSSESNGIYFIRTTNVNGISTIKKLIKK